MLNDIVAVRVLDGHRLHLVFDDGISGDVDIASIVKFTGIFAPLKDVAYFQNVRVDTETGTVSWPNGADIDPDVLNHQITGEPISIFRTKTNA